MAADQPNRQYWKYVDDNAVVWNKVGQIDAACNAIDGSAALQAGAPVWRDGRRQRSRRAIFQDATTFRTKTCPIYTAAAYAAITGATTIAVHVQGEAATVTYALAEKVPEKQPIAKASRNDPDHA